MNPVTTGANTRLTPGRATRAAINRCGNSHAESRPAIEPPNASPIVDTAGLIGLQRSSSPLRVSAASSKNI